MMREMTSRKRAMTALIMASNPGEREMNLMRLSGLSPGAGVC